MAQFHVYRIRDVLVLDLQSDLIDTGTRMVAPLFEIGAGPRPLPRLEPIVTVDGRQYALHTAEMAAVPAGLLNAPPVADLRGSDYQIRGSLDMVFSGF